jgi:hypothetical protein
MDGTKMAGTFGSGIKWTYETTILKISGGKHGKHGGKHGDSVLIK